MSKFSLGIASNDIPVDAFLEVFFPLGICTHHFNVESEHCDMDTCWHLVDGSDIGEDDIISVFPGE